MLGQPSGVKSNSSEGAFTCFKCAESGVQQHPQSSRICVSCYDDSSLKAIAAKKRRETNLLRKFGITVEAWEEMFERQDGGCAICHRVQKSGAKRLAVDHCHTTGRVRGLLCYRCNYAIGMFKDEPYLLQRATDYLNAQPGETEG